MSGTQTVTDGQRPIDEPPRSPRGRMWFGQSTGTALVAKIVGLAIVDALAIFAATILVGEEAWGFLAALVALTVLINWAYISPRAIAAKYLVPGLIFLLVYQIFVVLYTLVLSFTNFSDVNQGTQQGTIDTILAREERRVPDSPAYPLEVIQDTGIGGQGLGFLVTDPDTGEELFGFADQPLQPLGDAQFTPLTFAEIVQIQAEVFELRVPISDDPSDGSIRTQDGSTGFEFVPTLRYDAEQDALVNDETGEVFLADNEIGRFVSTETGQRLAPGWQVFVGFENYTRVLTDERIRGPFFEVFIWNIVFAIASVAFPFALGLAGALVLQHKSMRFTRAYRSILILPYAVPAFLTTLIWRGLLNRDFGFINQVLLDGATINWLGDPWLARFSVIFIQLWLGFPYFLIVSTGALTSIPDDVLEAAKMDGANAFQTFWQVKWPLLLVAVAPLMIASFAFNFNNFNVIEFSTGGGPTFTEAAVSYGATDILITFVDKLAFSGATREYGFASSIAIIIFLFVAVISYVQFRRTQSFEEID